MLRDWLCRREGKICEERKIGGVSGRFWVSVDMERKEGRGGERVRMDHKGLFWGWGEGEDEPSSACPPQPASSRRL